MENRIKRDIYQKINIDAINIKSHSPQLEKNLNEINQSEYIYSLIENVNNKANYNRIKREMNLPRKNKSKDAITNDNPYSKFWNIYNYKTINRKFESIGAFEIDTINQLLAKIDNKLTMNKKSKSNLSFLLKDRQNSLRKRNMTESTRYHVSPSNIRDTYHNKHIDFYTYTLNEPLFTIMQQVQSKQSEMEKKMMIISKGLRNEKKMDKDKVKDKEKEKWKPNCIYKKEKFPFEPPFRFPFINMKIYGSNKRNDYIELKNKMYEKYKIKRKLNYLNKKKENAIKLMERRKNQEENEYNEEEEEEEEEFY